MKGTLETDSKYSTPASNKLLVTASLGSDRLLVLDWSDAG